MFRKSLRDSSLLEFGRREIETAAREVLVSGTTRDLAEGVSGLEFESRGRFGLKGLSREHELFSVSAR